MWEIDRSPSGEGQREARGIQPTIEVREHVGALPRVVGPARRDQLHRPRGGERRPPLVMEERGVRRVADHDRIPELEPQLAVHLEAVPRLEHRRIRQRMVQRDDLPVGAVVEPAVDADRAVDAMHKPAIATGEAAQASGVEVERVEETDGRPPEIRLISTVSSRRRSSPTSPAGTGGRRLAAVARTHGRPRRRRPGLAYESRRLRLDGTPDGREGTAGMDVRRSGLRAESHGRQSRRHGGSRRAKGGC